MAKTQGCTVNENYKIVEASGAKIIIENQLSNRIPLSCPMCKMLMRDRGDVIAYATFSCCRQCEMEIAYPNKERWLEGWRPSDDALSLLRQKRKELPSYLKRS